MHLEVLNVLRPDIVHIYQCTVHVQFYNHNIDILSSTEARALVHYSALLTKEITVA